MLPIGKQIRCARRFVFLPGNWALAMHGGVDLLSAVDGCFGPDFHFPIPAV